MRPNPGNTRGRAIRLTLLLGFGTIAGVLLQARTPVAQVPSGGDACRKRIGTAANQYLRTISKVRQGCFRGQMEGELPLFPTLDCSEPATWAAAGYDAGLAKLAKAAQVTATVIGKRCSGALHPGMLGYGACPAPCESVAPSIDNFTDVSNCLQCLGDHCQQYVDGEAYGNAPLLDQRSDLPGLSCQLAIGRAVGDYAYKRLKLQAKCQARRDRQRSGWIGVDCTDAESPLHPQHPDLLSLISSLQGSVARACADPRTLSNILDTCGTNVADVTGCLGQAAASCVDVVHGAVYPDSSQPTPTSGVGPSPTSTRTPVPQGRPCSQDSECSGSVCSADGVCCDDRCEGTCESCLEAHTGSADGLCSAILQGDDPQGECSDGNICTLDSCDGARACQAVAASAGVACGDTGDDSCTAPDTCDGSGVCRPNHRLPGTECGDPGTPCVPRDTCDGAGTCRDSGFSPGGTSCGSPESECSAQDTCDGTGGCVPNNRPAGISCGDLAGPCTNADACDGQGGCGDAGFVAPGTNCGLPATECSGQDACDGAGVCQPNHQNVGAPCGPPANECTQAGSCDGSGRCTVEFLPEGAACGAVGTTCSAQDTCDGAGTCRVNHVVPGTACGDSGSACTNQDVCNGDGQCVDNGFPAPGTVCGDPATECSERDTCDGAGTCERHDLLAGASCGSALATDCTAPDTCDGAGSCRVNNATLGANCGDAGSECTVQDTCDANGACIDHGFIAATTACGDPTSNACTQPDTCNGSGVCQPNDTASGTSCGDAGNECALQDSCDGFGACRDRGYRPLGTACGSQVDTQCDDPDSCDGAGACRGNFPTAGTPCGDQGSACVVQDTCNGGGTCADNGFRTAGTSCGDPSDTTCTDPDSCNASGVCISNNAADGSNCGDAGTQCVVQDTCSGGTCRDNGFVATGSTCGSATDTECDNPDSCNGAGACRPNFEISGFSCGDPGAPCLNQDVCNGSGTCLDVGMAPVGSPCADDNNPCTDDICASAGVCQHLPNQLPCDDGLFCNGTDTCSAGGCVLHTSNPCPGPDGDTNCSETCNESLKACVAPDPDGSPCDDKLYCNGTEICNGGLCVSQNIDPCPNGGAYGGDDDINCRESCDEFTNTCTAPDPDGIPCNDRVNPASSNMFCTGGDVGNPCVQGSDCSSGICGDVCTGPDNGKPCVGNDDCPGGGNCSGRACVSTTYEVDTRGVIATTTIEPDKCQQGVCVPGAPPCPGDLKDTLGRGIGLALTCQDACNEAADSCTSPSVVNGAIKVVCSNSDFCDGALDTCELGAGSIVECRRSTDPCAANLNQVDSDCSQSCNDETACSTWASTPGTHRRCVGVGSCTANDPNNSICGDGNFCTLGDRCTNGNCISGSSNPCPGPGNANNDCSETCVDTDSGGYEVGNCNGNDTNGSSCTDYLYCDGSDSCLNGDCRPSNVDPCANRVSDVNDGVLDSDCSESCFEPADGATGNSNGSCTANDPANSFCDDTKYCNGNLSTGNRDTCDGSGLCGSRCVGGTNAGNYCTTNAECPGAVGAFCRGAINPCLSRIGDADSDCSESCDEGARTCTATDPVGSSCSDSLHCTLTDTCTVVSSVLTCRGVGDPCAPDRGPTGANDNRNCHDSCNEGDFGSCTAPDPELSNCESDGRSCNGAEHCRGGVCKGDGVCCTTPHDFVFDLSSNSGGTADSAEWNGGHPVLSGPILPGTSNNETECKIGACMPTGNIDLVGSLGGYSFGIFTCDGQDFEVDNRDRRGYTSCVGFQQEDNDGCDPDGCPPAGIGFCQAGRPSCSAALNGSASAQFHVRCTD